jgi:hypothetical protein
MTKGEKRSADGEAKKATDKGVDEKKEEAAVAEKKKEEVAQADKPEQPPPEKKPKLEEGWAATVVKLMSMCPRDGVTFAMGAHLVSKEVQRAGCAAYTKGSSKLDEGETRAVKAVLETHGDAETVDAALGAAGKAASGVAITEGLVECMLKTATTNEAVTQSVLSTVNKLVSADAPYIGDACASHLSVLAEDLAWKTEAAEAACNVLSSAACHKQLASTPAIPALVNVMRSHALCTCGPVGTAGAQCAAFQAAAKALTKLVQTSKEGADKARTMRVATAIGPRKDSEVAKELMAALG